MTLSDYLTEAGRGAMSKIAREAGVSVVSVLRWKRGDALPSWKHIPAIERATNGAVTARDFVPQQSAA